ncbi:15-cis-phytoene desaturase [Rosistilla oblonga]|uniref:hydroxysqualene dehydroxylase HpnE n=1 Tax=Rosistilla oblonga TaxID=2527990 RepID=UPI0011899531|nr:hydroxysqualene dehydroxylase HpnE [Rosistilla oblonga]QDV11190.1 15-cis-phytoene desaturase [Rosistilla oblonga]
METSPPRIAIVGGGLAGMAAALGLSQAGLKVTLIEARSKTGGRAGSFIDPTTGTEIDYCQHVGMGCCTNLLDLLKRTGQLDDWRRYRSLTFIGPAGEVCPFAGSRWLPAPLHLMEAFSGLSYLSQDLRKTIAQGIWKLMRLRPEDQANWPTMQDWLTAAGQSEAAIREFWDVILVSALGEATDRVAVAPARKVLVDGFLSHRDAGDVWVPQLPLSVLFGQRLPDDLTRRGVEIRLSARATGIESHGGRATGVRLSDGSTIAADYLLIATPWHQLQNVLGDASDAVDDGESIASIPASPITGIHLWCDRPLTDADHLVFVGRTIQWLFRPTFAGDQPGRIYHQIVISGSRDLPPRQQLLDEVIAELRELLPAAREANVVDSRIVTDPKSVYSVSLATEKRRPAATTRLPNLWLAGDWTATGWPATMESAVISGYRAADQIADNLGRRSGNEQPALAKSWLARLLIR